MSGVDQPNSLWPVGSRVTFVDARGFSPRPGQVIRHYNQQEVLIEDDRGVHHFCRTWRIKTNPRPLDSFDDLLGDGPEPAPQAPKQSLFEDLLG